MTTSPDSSGLTVSALSLTAFLFRRAIQKPPMALANATRTKISRDSKFTWHVHNLLRDAHVFSEDVRVRNVKSAQQPKVGVILQQGGCLFRLHQIGRASCRER